MAKILKIEVVVSDTLPPGFNFYVLMRAALIEFAQARTPPLSYLHKRYDTEFIKSHPNKLSEIEQRVKVAKQMADTLRIIE